MPDLSKAIQILQMQTVIWQEQAREHHVASSAAEEPWYHHETAEKLHTWITVLQAAIDILRAQPENAEVAPQSPISGLSPATPAKEGDRQNAIHSRRFAMASKNNAEPQKDSK